jgi:predicted enzyme related to lactoylglutathione lyase
MFKGLTGVIYFIPEEQLTAARDWYVKLLGVQPYMERTFFVTFLVAGLELCLHRASEKAQSGTSGQTAYWLVDDLAKAMEWFVECGATPYRRLLEVSEGGFVMQFKDPFGNVVGIREKGPV